MAIKRIFHPMQFLNLVMHKLSIIHFIGLVFGENVVEKQTIFHIDVKMPNIPKQKRNLLKVLKLLHVSRSNWIFIGNLGFFLDRSAPSMACFIAASGLLAIAIVLFTRGLCKRRRKAVFFISGLLFSISGNSSSIFSRIKCEEFVDD